jgi:hypothetical protein
MSLFRGATFGWTCSIRNARMNDEVFEILYATVISNPYGEAFNLPDFRTACEKIITGNSHDVMMNFASSI